MNKPEKLGKWRSLIAEQKESGQSAAAFCRTRGLREALFYYWKKQLPEVGRSQFVEVKVEAVEIPRSKVVNRRQRKPHLTPQEFANLLLLNR